MMDINPDTLSILQRAMAGDVKHVALHGGGRGAAALLSTFLTLTSACGTLHGTQGQMYALNNAEALYVSLENSLLNANWYPIGNGQFVGAMQGDFSVLADFQNPGWVKLLPNEQHSFDPTKNGPDPNNGQYERINPEQQLRLERAVLNNVIEKAAWVQVGKSGEPGKFWGAVEGEGSKFSVRIDLTNLGYVEIVQNAQDGSSDPDGVTMRIRVSDKMFAELEGKVRDVNPQACAGYVSAIHAMDNLLACNGKQVIGGQVLKFNQPVTLGVDLKNTAIPGAGRMFPVEVREVAAFKNGRQEMVRMVLSDETWFDVSRFDLPPSVAGGLRELGLGISGEDFADAWRQGAQIERDAQAAREAEKAAEMAEQAALRQNKRYKKIFAEELAKLRERNKKCLAGMEAVERNLAIDAIVINATKFVDNSGGNDDFSKFLRAEAIEYRTAVYADVPREKRKLAAVRNTMGACVISNIGEVASERAKAILAAEQKTEEAKRGAAFEKKQQRRNASMRRRDH